MRHTTPVTLFVDHDHSWSQELRSDLQRRGTRVMLAESIHELNEMIDRLPPGPAVASADLPAGDRPEALATIRKRLDQVDLVILEPPGAEPIDGLAARMSPRHYGKRPEQPRDLLQVLLPILARRAGKAELPERRPPLILCVDDEPMYLKSLDRI